MSVGWGRAGWGEGPWGQPAVVNVTVNVIGNFNEVSIYCYYHGYMGGENLLKYTQE